MCLVVLPYQAKKPKVHNIPVVWFATDSPAVFYKQLQFWKTYFRPTSSVLLGLNCSCAANVVPSQRIR